jgi:hypothetical protein
VPPSTANLHAFESGTMSDAAGYHHVVVGQHAASRTSSTPGHVDFAAVNICWRRSWDRERGELGTRRPTYSGICDLCQANSHDG